MPEDLGKLDASVLARRVKNGVVDIDTIPIKKRMEVQSILDVGAPSDTEEIPEHDRLLTQAQEVEIAPAPKKPKKPKKTK